MEPLSLSGDADAALRVIRELVAAMPGARIQQLDDAYLHVEFRSRWMGFVDDVEFYVDAAAGVIHFRSASRLGYSDFGVNRDRMERIRAGYLERLNAADQTGSQPRGPSG
jgi:uncharacterized protein (DUF1499 family)